jgi:hypothetical protein
MPAGASMPRRTIANYFDNPRSQVPAFPQSFREKLGDGASTIEHGGDDCGLEILVSRGVSRLQFWTFRSV